VGGEPVLLFLHHNENNTTYVAKNEARHAIGLPFEQVFDFDEQFFVFLKGSFEPGNVDKV
jgi:hypothetical protein